MQIERVGFWPWFLQRVTAVFLTVGMAVHMFVLPLKGKVIDFNSVNARLSHAGWLIFDLALLAACMYHGFNGLWAVILDYGPKGMSRTGYGLLIAGVGVAIFVLGIFALIPMAME